MHDLNCQFCSGKNETERLAPVSSYQVGMPNCLRFRHSEAVSNKLASQHSDLDLEDSALQYEHIESVLQALQSEEGSKPDGTVGQPLGDIASASGELPAASEQLPEALSSTEGAAAVAGNGSAPAAAKSAESFDSSVDPRSYGVLM